MGHGQKHVPGVGARSGIRATWRGNVEGAPALVCSAPGTWARQGAGEERVRDVPASCHKAFADLSINISQKG